MQIDLIKIIPGPDFPTAGIINGRAGIEAAYRTGRGKIRVRSKITIESDETSHKQAIIIDELPYQVNKASLLERIAELVKEKKIEGITAVRDESDKDGMRVVIELRRGEIAEVILNNLFLNTQMQVTFGINIVALDNGQPKTLNLKQLLEAFLKHRREVVVRRCVFELKQARKKAHILEGLSIALANIDEMIALIKKSKSPVIAKQELLDRSRRRGGARWRCWGGGEWSRASGPAPRPAAWWFRRVSGGLRRRRDWRQWPGGGARGRLRCLRDGG